MKTLTILFFLALFFKINCYSQSIDEGYILEIRGDKVYLDLKSGDVEIGNKFQVIKEGGFFIHPVSGEKIKEENEIIAILEIVDVKLNYSIAAVYPAEVISLLSKGVKVSRLKEHTINSQQFKKSIAVQPLTVSNVQGYLGIYIGDALTEELLKAEMFRVLDRQTLGLQPDQIVLSAGGVLSETDLLKYSTNKGADYYITGTMYEPDVVELSSGIPVKNIVKLVGKAAEVATGKDLKVDLISEFVPNQTEIRRLKAIVKISLRVVDVKTGEIKFLCTEMQQSEGESDINLEGGLLNGFKIRGGVSAFQNTITGKATELALKNLTGYIVDYFKGNILEKAFTGNIIEIKDLNKKVPSEKKYNSEEIVITDFIKKPIKNEVTFLYDTIFLVGINKGLNKKIKPKSYLNVYTSSPFYTIDNSETLPIQVIKIGHIDITSSSKENAEGEIRFKKKFNEAEFNKEISYAKIKNIWSTVFIIVKPPINKPSPGADYGNSSINLGYSLNWSVGFFVYIGPGSGIWDPDTEKQYVELLNIGFGITKSIDKRTSLGLGINPKFDLEDFYPISADIDFLFSSRFRSNLTLLYGISFEPAASRLIIPLGIGISF